MLSMRSLKEVKMSRDEKEYQFNFRGLALGVEAESKESAYGYFYSTYHNVSKAELDNAYQGGKDE